MKIRSIGAVLALAVPLIGACTPSTSADCPWSDSVDEVAVAPDGYTSARVWCEGTDQVSGQTRITDVSASLTSDGSTINVIVASSIGVHGGVVGPWAINLGGSAPAPGQYAMVYYGKPGTVTITEVAVDAATGNVTRLRATYRGAIDTSTTSGTFHIG